MTRLFAAVVGIACLTAGGAHAQASDQQQVETVPPQLEAFVVLLHQLQALPQDQALKSLVGQASKGDETAFNLLGTLINLGDPKVAGPWHDILVAIAPDGQDLYDYCGKLADQIKTIASASGADTVEKIAAALGYQPPNAAKPAQPASPTGASLTKAADAIGRISDSVDPSAPAQTFDGSQTPAPAIDAPTPANGADSGGEGGDPQGWSHKTSVEGGQQGLRVSHEADFNKGRLSNTLEATGAAAPGKKYGDVNDQVQLSIGKSNNFVYTNGDAEYNKPVTGMSSLRAEFGVGRTMGHGGQQVTVQPGVGEEHDSYVDGKSETMLSPSLSLEYVGQLWKHLQITEQDEAAGDTKDKSDWWNESSLDAVIHLAKLPVDIVIHHTDRFYNEPVQTPQKTFPQFTGDTSAGIQFDPTSLFQRQKKSDSER